MSSPKPSSFPTLPAGTSEPDFDLITWLEVNKKTLLAVLAALVLATVVTMFVRWQHTNAEAEANRALLAATIKETPGAAADSATLLKIADEHAGTRAAERARLLAATQLFAEGKPAEARAQFEKFNADYPDSSLAGTAALGIASSFDAENKSAEAVAAYQRVIGSFGTEPVAAQARLAKALLHEAANQPEQALALYDELAKSPTAGAEAQAAMVARARLLQKHPELDKPAVMTNNVKVAAPAAAKVPPTK
jgi:TolA-binding protein